MDSVFGKTWLKRGRAGFGERWSMGCGVKTVGVQRSEFGVDYETFDTKRTSAYAGSADCGRGL